MNKFERAAKLRQQALDLIWERGNVGVYSNDLVEAIPSLSKQTASRMLQSMEANGELSRTLTYRETISAKQLIRVPAYLYVAKVKTTRSADEVQASMIEAMRDTVCTRKSIAPAEATGARPPWASGPIDENRPAIRNQGGQGAMIRSYGGGFSATELV
mgnify:CR=1 FL=1